jgi:hypothetical protein
MTTVKRPSLCAARASAVKEKRQRRPAIKTAGRNCVSVNMDDLCGTQTAGRTESAPDDAAFQ